MTCGISEICNKSGYVALSVRGKARTEVKDSLLPEFAQSPWTPFCWSYYEASWMEEERGSQSSFPTETTWVEWSLKAYGKKIYRYILIYIENISDWKLTYFFFCINAMPSSFSKKLFWPYSEPVITKHGISAMSTRP